MNDSIIYDIYLNKTAWYTIIGPILIGAASASASTEDKEKLTVMGSYLGIAFQIKDDLLGLYSTSSSMGKTLNDVKEGIIASRIAAHAADVAKGLPGAKDWDFEMSEARRNLDWEKQFELAIDPEKARRYRAESKPEKEDTCTMCGKMCAVRNINKILRGEDVDIMD